MTGSWRIAVVFFIVVSLILTSVSDQTAHDLESTELSTDYFANLAEASATPHDPIEIRDDDDFREQGWLGSGTEEDPFVISGLSIQSSEICIEIIMTSVHFLVSQCELVGSSLDDNYGIRLYSVENGVLDSNTLDGCGIRVEESAQVLVTNNTIEDAGWDGIAVLRSSQCVISRNYIYSTLSDGIYAEFNVGCDYLGNHIWSVASGIRINGDFQSTFRFNYLRGGWYYGIELSPGSENVLFGNYIASFDEGPAYDAGSENRWDDGLAIGNLWEQYRFAGEVTIPGAAESIDSHPLTIGNFSYIWPFPPLITSPSDSVLSVGQGYENLTWAVWSIPYSYSISLNGESIDTGDCEGSGCHSVIIEKQYTGRYNLTISVHDVSNSTRVDMVFIDVMIPSHRIQVILAASVGGVVVFVVFLEFRTRSRAQGVTEKRSPPRQA